MAVFALLQSTSQVRTPNGHLCWYLGSETYAYVIRNSIIRHVQKQRDSMLLAFVIFTHFARRRRIYKTPHASDRKRHHKSLYVDLCSMLFLCGNFAFTLQNEHGDREMQFNKKWRKQCTSSTLEEDRWATEQDDICKDTGATQVWKNLQDIDNENLLWIILPTFINFNK